ncbi:MAG: hypothetical protein ACREDP_15995, partial [Bradyrhizobium sp.]
PSRRESRDASAALYARVRTSLPIARETAGAARTRLSLRPLYFEGGNRRITRAHRAARMRAHAFTLFEM